ncbi:MAG: arylsulfatase [Gammaproteobacteria bacterium]|nr:arylsulfatase [Gammaproteobacteria bacterium]
MRIVLIHALEGAIGPIREAFEADWPQAGIFNLMDDSLSVDRARDGGLTPAMVERFVTLTDYAVAAGADGILFTCSAFHRAIEVARAKHTIPILKPDEAMMEAALEAERHIALLATFEPTLATAKAEMERLAAAAGRRIEVSAVHVPGALSALQAGDAAGHDDLIVRKAGELTGADAVMLAQFTMAPVAPRVRLPGGGPVFTSPGTAVRKLRQRLGG